MSEGINITLGGDQNVVDGLAVVIASARKALPSKTQLNAFVIDCGLTPESRLALEALGAVLPATTVKILPLDPALLSDFPLPSGLKHLTLGAYARLFTHDLLPELDTIIYLDADLLVRADLSKLANIPLEEAVLAAVCTPDVPNFESPPESFSQELAEVPGSTPYFNSGVMVLNLRKLRERSAGTLYRAMARRISCRCGDQSILNAVFHGQWLSLDRRWNRMAPLHPSYRLYENAAQTIWHLAGKMKPWQFAPASNAGLLTLWQEELAQLGWKRRSPATFSVGPITRQDRLRQIKGTLTKAAGFWTKNSSR